MSPDLSYRERALQAEARVVELETELAEWRGLRAADSFDPLFLQALQWARSEDDRHPVGVARLLVFLLGHPGVVLSRVKVADAVSRLDRHERASDQIASVVVSHARRLLVGRGLGEAIKTHWGQGYELGRADAERLRATLAEIGA